MNIFSGYSNPHDVDEAILLKQKSLKPNLSQIFKIIFF
jgi:hypothetical protein